jgi:hypothetical protein
MNGEAAGQDEQRTGHVAGQVPSDAAMKHPAKRAILPRTDDQ